MMTGRKLLIWLRLGRRKTYLWRTIAVVACDYLYSSGVKREQAKVNFLAALWKLDTPKIIEFMNELLW